MQNDKLNKLASVISKLLHPVVFSLITLFVVIYSFSSNNKDFVSWSAISLFFLVIIPAGYILHFVKKGSITDVDVLIRQHRSNPFIIVILTVLILKYFGY